MADQLSPHFSFDELTKTGQAALQVQNRKEAMAVRASLLRVATELLEPIRAKFGPVSVHSAFRGLSVNTAVGGSKTSQHMKGEACDFHCAAASLETVFAWVRHESGIKVGQLILEGHEPNKPSWIHISLPTATVHDQYLTFDGSKYRQAPG